MGQIAMNVSSHFAYENTLAVLRLVDTWAVASRKQARHRIVASRCRGGSMWNVGMNIGNDDFKDRYDGFAISRTTCPIDRMQGGDYCLVIYSLATAAKAGQSGVRIFGGGMPILSSFRNAAWRR